MPLKPSCLNGRGFPAPQKHWMNDRGLHIGHQNGRMDYGQKQYQRPHKGRKQHSTGRE